MKDTIVVDGKEYISVSRAAEITKYSKDYIGQLCRSGKVASVMPGRNRWIDEASLLAHKKNSDEAVRTAGKQIAARIASGQKYPQIKWTFSYEGDDRPLLPELHKTVSNARDGSHFLHKKAKAAISTFRPSASHIRQFAVLLFVLTFTTTSAFAMVNPSAFGRVAAEIGSNGIAAVEQAIGNLSNLPTSSFNAVSNGTSNSASALSAWWQATSGKAVVTIRTWLGIGGSSSEELVLTIATSTSGATSGSQNSVPTSISITATEPVSSGAVTSAASSLSSKPVQASAPVSSPVAYNTTIYKTDPTLSNRVDQLEKNLNDFKAFEARQTDAIYDSVGNSAPLTGVSSGGGSGSVTSIDASGGSTGLTFTGGPVTSSGTLTLSGVLGASNGGTGTSTTPALGNLLIGDGNGGYKLVATSTLGLGGSGAVDSVSNSDGSLTIGPTTGSVVASLNLGHSNTFTAAQTFNGGITANSLSLGSLNGPLQANNGVVSATTSIGVLYGGTGLTAAPSFGQVLVGNSNGGYSLVSTSSLGLPQFSDLNSYLTTAAAASTYLTQTNAASTYLTQSNAASTYLSQASFNALDKGYFFSTTSANYFINASSTIAHPAGGVAGNVIEWDGSKWISVSTSSLGIVAGGSGSAAYPFALAGNATSTLTQFNGGLTAFGSSTIGNGLQAGGLTINGGATTTGTFNILSTISPQFTLGYDLNNYLAFSEDQLGNSKLNFNGASSSILMTFAPPADVVGITGLNATTSLYVQGAAGGGSSGSGNNRGGVGGGIVLNGGSGGLTSSTGSTANGGRGGDIDLTGGAGGVSSTSGGTNTAAGGIGGNLILSSGAGGTPIGSGSQITVGGDAGIVKLLGGNGASVSGASLLNLGGAGGNVYVAPGQGGTGANSNGNPGTLYLGYNGTSAVGNVVFGNNGGLFNTSTGFFGIGTTSPYAKLSVDGRGVFNQDVRANYFTSTSTSFASTFPYASTTALSATSLFASSLCLSGDCRSVWPTGGSGGAGTWSTTTSQVSNESINYSNSNTDIVAVGGTSTSTAKFFLDPNTQQAYLGSTTIGSSYVPARANLEVRGTSGNSVFFSNPNVNQGTTLLLPSDVYGAVQELDTGRGSLGITGLTTFPNSYGVQIEGIGAGNINPGIATVALVGAVNSGTGIDYVPDASAVFAVINRNRQTFNVMGNGNVGIGTSSPYSMLSVAGQVVAQNFISTSSIASTFPYASTTALSAQTICFTGDTCRTTWPTGGSGAAYPFALAGNATSTLTQFNGGLTAYASSTIGNLSVIGPAGQANPFMVASSTGRALLTVNPNGTVMIPNQIGLGNVASPSATLAIQPSPSNQQVAINSAVANVDANLSDNSNTFTQTNLDSSLGNMTVGGSVMSVSRSSVNFTNGTLSASSPVAAFSENACSNIGGGTCTTSADVLDVSQLNANATGAALNVTTAGTGYAFRVNDDGTLTDTTPFVIDATGRTGIGTTSPWRTLSVNGSSDLGVNALAGSFTATSSTASIFPYASTTALSAQTICFTGDTCRTTWPTGSGGAAYPFGLAGNATSTLTQFNGGLTAYASSTIGAGATTTGLTINGFATSTLGMYSGGSITSNGGVVATTYFGSNNPFGANYFTGTIQNTGYFMDTINSKQFGIYTGGGGGGSDNLILRSGNTDRLYLNQFTGNIGVATSSPWAALSVNPSHVSGPEFAVGSSTKTDFIVTNGGKVGVGSSSPSALLSVQGTTVVGQNAPDVLDVYGGASGFIGGGITLKAGDGDSAGGAISINSGNGTAEGNGGDLNLTAGNGRQDALLAGNVNITAGNGGSMAVDQTQVGNIVLNPGVITPNFLNGNVSGNGFVLLAPTGGNVGIGTSSPYAKLSVAGQTVAQYFTATSTSVASVFPYASTTAVTASTLYTNTLCLSGDCRTFWPTGSGGSAGTWSTTTSQVSGQLVNFSNNSSDIVAVGSNSTTTAKFFFNPNNQVGYVAGSLGIGTASPASKLDIVSSANSAAAVTLRDVLGGISLELRAGTSTLSNAFVGAGAAALNTTGTQNTAFGSIALAQNTTGSQNAATGYESLFHNTTGSFDTGTGYAALLNNTTGTNNTGDGYQALLHNTTGSFNSTLGSNSLGANTTGNYNVAVGENAGWAGTGQYSGDVFVGYKTSWNANSVLASTTELGYEAGYNYAGNFSTLLGYQAGYDLVSGSSNIAIGANVDLPSNTGSNQLNIGNLIYGTGVYSGSTPSATPAVGNIGIGTTSPWRTLSVNGSSDLGINALAGYFTATSSTASQFPYASTTALSAQTICFTGDTCRTTWPTGGAGSGGGTWSTTTSQVAGQLVNYSNNNSDIVAIGSNSTTTAKFFFNPNNGNSLLGSTTGIGTASPRGNLEIRSTGTGSLGGTPSIVLSDPNVNHGITLFTPTDVFGLIRSEDPGRGSLGITGIATFPSDAGVAIKGIGPSNLNQSTGAVSIQGFVQAGPGAGAIANSNTVLSVVNANQNVPLSVMGGGQLGISTTSPFGFLSVNPMPGVTGAQFVIGSSTGTSFIVDNGGRVGIGTAGPLATLDLVNNGTGADPTELFRNNTVNCGATNVMGTTDAFGKIGIGQATGGTLLIDGCNESNGEGLILRGTDAVGSPNLNQPSLTLIGQKLSGAGGAPMADSETVMNFVNNQVLLGTFKGSGFFGIGTSTPYAALSVVGSTGVVADHYAATSTTATSTFAGGLNVGNGGLTYDFSSGVTSIANLSTGPMNFDTDAGAVSWVDMPIDSSASNGTPESYTAQIGGSPILTVYGQATGSGGSQNLAVGIGTTSPFALLSVQGGATSSPVFAIATTTGVGQSLIIDKNGLLTLNTPGATSTINGNLFVNGTLRGTNVYSGDLVFANNFRFTEASTTDASTPSGLDGLYLKNQDMKDLMSIDKNGNLTVTGDVCSNGTQCYGQSISNLAASLQALASTTAVTSGTAQSALTTASSFSQLNTNVAAVTNTVSTLSEELSALASTTADVQSSLAEATSTLASTTASNLATSTSFIQTIATAVKDLIQSAGDWVVAKVSATLAVFTRVETQTASVSNGLEMTDSATGQVYCVRITNGDFAKMLGSCTATSTPVTAPLVVSTPVTTPQPTVQNQTVVETTGSTQTSTTTTTTVTTATSTSTTSSVGTTTPSTGGSVTSTSTAPSAQTGTASTATSTPVTTQPTTSTTVSSSTLSTTPPTDPAPEMTASTQTPSTSTTASSDSTTNTDQTTTSTQTTSPTPSSPPASPPAGGGDSAPVASGDSVTTP